MSSHHTVHLFLLYRISRIHIRPRLYENEAALEVTVASCEEKRSVMTILNIEDEKEKIYGSRTINSYYRLTDDDQHVNRVYIIVLSQQQNYRWKCNLNRDTDTKKREHCTCTTNKRFFDQLYHFYLPFIRTRYKI